MIAVRMPRMVEHRKEELGEMSQVCAQKQALRDDLAGPWQVRSIDAVRRLVNGIRVKKPSETAPSGLVDRP